MENISGQTSVRRRRSSDAEDEGRDELQVTTKVAESIDITPDLMEMILAKLYLHDFVRVHFTLSAERRHLTSSRVFEGEPFYLLGPRRGGNPESNPLVASVYAFSRQKWVQLPLPPSAQDLLPISASGGLVLFSGVPVDGYVPRAPGSWPLVVFNPITHQTRFLSLQIERPPEMITNSHGRLLCYDQVHMGLKVSADCKTYKVVVHWRGCYVVQIFDSGSNEWTTGDVPTDLVSYADSSDDIVSCRFYQRKSEDSSSVFDIRQGKLVDCSLKGVLQDELATLARNPIFLDLKAWGFPTVGESCLYAVSNSLHPSPLYVRIHKRERRSRAWQLVTEVPAEVLRSIKWPVSFRYVRQFMGSINLPSNLRLYVISLEILECGNHLLLAVMHGFCWCGASYDLQSRRWSVHDTSNVHPLIERVCDGLFFQPQLNEPSGPC